MNPTPSTSSSTLDTELDVRGMTCGACVRHVRGALEALDGVETIDVRLAEKKVKVRHDPSQTQATALAETLTRAGYPANVAPQH